MTLQFSKINFLKQWKDVTILVWFYFIIYFPLLCLDVICLDINCFVLSNPLFSSSLTKGICYTTLKADKHISQFCMTHLCGHFLNFDFKTILHFGVCVQSRTLSFPHILLLTLRSLLPTFTRHILLFLIRVSFQTTSHSVRSTCTPTHK